MPVTNIQLAVDNVLITDAVAAMRWKSGYQAQIPDLNNPEQMIANPETSMQSAKKRIKQLIMNDVADYRAMQAQASQQPVADNLIN